MNGPIQVILNPVSGGGAGRRMRRELERELAARRLEFTLAETEDRGHAVELAGAAAVAGVAAVVAVGGDGTVHEVANGLLRAGEARGATGPPDRSADRTSPAAGPALGVVATGTGNDFVKTLGVAGPRSRAYDILAAGHVRRFDAGLVRWDGGEATGTATGGSEYFVNGMGTGVDVEVVRQIERLPRMPGVASYLVGLVRAVVGFRPIPLRVRLDGTPTERVLMIIAVGNGPCQGGGFYVCPDAVPDDGRFDTCMVGELSYWQIARVIPRVMKGTHTGLPVVSMGRVQRLELESLDGRPLFFQLDGELRQPDDARRIRVEVCRGALPVLARPAGGAP